MATLKEISEITKLSPSTISRILNEDSSLNVQESTKKRVLEVAQQLNYKFTKKNNKNVSASNGNFVVISSFSEKEEINDPYYLSIKYGIKNEATLKNINVSFFYESDFSAIKDADGIIVIGKFSDESLEVLEKVTSNILLLDQQKKSAKFDNISIDLEEITKSILTHFRKCGFKKIGYIGARDFEEIRDEREKIFVNYCILNSLNYTNSLYVGNEFSSNVGYELMTKMVNDGNVPEAILVANDSLAIGVIKACHENKISIPEMLSIFSINDIPASEFTFPSLSTVHIDSEFLGSFGLKLLLDRYETNRQFPVSVTIPTSLVFRESCKKLEDTL